MADQPVPLHAGQNTAVVDVADATVSEQAVVTLYRPLCADEGVVDDTLDLVGILDFAGQPQKLPGELESGNGHARLRRTGMVLLDAFSGEVVIGFEPLQIAGCAGDVVAFCIDVIPGSCAGFEVSCLPGEPVVNRPHRRD